MSSLAGTLASLQGTPSANVGAWWDTLSWPCWSSRRGSREQVLNHVITITAINTYSEGRQFGTFLFNRSPLFPAILTKISVFIPSQCNEEIDMNEEIWNTKKANVPAFNLHLNLHCNRWVSVFAMAIVGDFVKMGYVVRGVWQPSWKENILHLKKKHCIVGIWGKCLLLHFLHFSLWKERKINLFHQFWVLLRVPL